MRLIALPTILLLLLVPVAQTSPLVAQVKPPSLAPADTDAVRAWIREHAIALTTVKAGSGFADLQPLRKIVGDARIVALGEATHGTREFFQLKHRLLEFLVSEMGFNIFVMEASLPEALDLNRYVLSGEGDPARALAAMYFWVWDTEEVLALIRWMREYNLTETRGRKVKFYGCDMQYTARAARTVAEYLQRVDPAAGKRANRVIEPLADPFVSAEGWRWAEARKQELADSLRRVVADFDERLDAYAAMTSAEEADLVRRHLEILVQAVLIERTEFSRDAAMAANTAWILGREGPDSKAVLWAHNTHLAVLEGREGEALRKMFGDDLRVFGFTFDRGGFQARDAMTGALRPWFVGGAPDTTLEAHLRVAAPGVALLDLRSLPEAGPVKSWFMAPQTVRWIPAGYSYELQDLDKNQRDFYWQRWPVAKVYDALVFVEETTPARANLTAHRPGAIPPVTNPANLGFEVGLPGAWPLGWIMPSGAALVEWDVRLTRADAREGKQAVVIRRAPGPAYGETYAALSQRVDATPWRGQPVKLRAWVRIDGGTESRGYLWLEITEPADPWPGLTEAPLAYSKSVFYESTGDRPITASEWRQYEITTNVSKAANIISFGFAFVGDGEAWLDGVSLETPAAKDSPSSAQCTHGKEGAPARR
jgi:erythromycin esterase